MQITEVCWMIYKFRKLVILNEGLVLLKSAVLGLIDTDGPCYENN